MHEFLAAHWWQIVGLLIICAIGAYETAKRGGGS